MWCLRCLYRARTSKGCREKNKAPASQRREGLRAGAQATETGLRSGQTGDRSPSTQSPPSSKLALFASEAARVSQQWDPLPDDKVLRSLRAWHQDVSEIQRPALVGWRHGHSTIAVLTILLLRRRIVVGDVLLRLLLLAVHRSVRRMRVVLTLRLSVLLGALSLRRLIRACEDRWLGVRRAVTSVLRHLSRCEGRWLILGIGRSRKSADLAAVPSVWLEGIDLRAGVAW
jgi:hypothetical protein